MDTFSAMQSLFPLTSPIPTASSVDSLINLDHLSLEHDLLKNPDQPARWAHYLSTITDEVLALELSARGKATELELSVLGAKLSTAEGRLGLQRMTDIYERAIAAEPKSFKLWKEYLAVRSKYVLGTAQNPVKLNGPKKRRGEDGTGRSMVEFLEAGTGQNDKLDDGERDVESAWEGGLDGVVGWEEWRSLAAVHERALMWLPNVRRSLGCLWDSQLTRVDYSCRVSGSRTSPSSPTPRARPRSRTRTRAGPSTAHCARSPTRYTRVSGACTSPGPSRSAARRRSASGAVTSR